MGWPEQDTALGNLAGSAWTGQLLEINSVYGRMVYLAGLRDPDTGRYEDYTADQRKRLEAHRSLKQIHEVIFRDWVSLSLERKKADIELYIAGINRADWAEIIDAWVRLTPFKNLIPASAPGPDRQKHISDVEAILGLLRNVYGVPSPDSCA